MTLALGMVTAVMASPAAALQVVATLPTLAALALEVGAPHAQVESLLGPRQDPHYADPRPNLILALHKADLLVVNGLELETGWLPGLVRQARNTRIQTGTNGWFDASQWVQRLQVPVRADRAMGDVHPGGNPHFAWDPRAGAAIAEALAKRLALLDPAHAADYQRKGSALAQRLRSFAASERSKFAGLPEAARQVAVYHDSLTYLVDWLGLKQVATIEPRPGIPPDPAQLARVVSVMRTTAARVVAQEEFYPRTMSDQVAKLTQARLVVLAGGVQLAQGQTYEAYVRQLSESLWGACRGP